MSFIEDLIHASHDLFGRLADSPWTDERTKSALINTSSDSERVATAFARTVFRNATQATCSPYIGITFFVSANDGLVHPTKICVVRRTTVSIDLGGHLSTGNVEASPELCREMDKLLRSISIDDIAAVYDQLMDGWELCLSEVRAVYRKQDSVTPNVPVFCESRAFYCKQDGGTPDALVLFECIFSHAERMKRYSGHVVYIRHYEGCRLISVKNDTQLLQEFVDEMGIVPTNLHKIV